MKLTSCPRFGSGSLNQTGMPRRTTPFVSAASEFLAGTNLIIIL
jgi:hypothetical protein